MSNKHAIIAGILNVVLVTATILFFILAIDSSAKQAPTTVIPLHEKTMTVEQLQPAATVFDIQPTGGVY